MARGVVAVPEAMLADWWRSAYDPWVVGNAVRLPDGSEGVLVAVVAAYGSEEVCWVVGVPEQAPVVLPASACRLART